MREMDVFRALFPRSGGAQPGRTRAYSGTALSDSSGGRVVVAVEGDSLTADGTNEVEVPCSPSVRAGDAVLVEGVDGSPMVTYAAGEGDRQDEAIDSVRQYFWHDSDGAHVSTEEGDAEGARNSLWTSAGMFFRSGANRLLALLAGTWTGLKIYDGGGNTEGHEVASFGPDLIELGKNSVQALIKFCGGKGVLGYFNSSQQAYMTAPRGAVIMADPTSDEALGLVADDNGVTTAVAVADKFQFDGDTLTRDQLAAAVDRWVVSKGSYGDWTWQVYQDGTFDAWCRPSGTTSYSITQTNGGQGWTYAKISGWEVSGLSYSRLTYVDVTPEFETAVLSSLYYIDGKYFGFYLLSLVSKTESGRVLVHARGII